MMEKEEFDSYVKAGEISREIKKFIRDLIKPGMKLIEIAEAIDSKIFELGGEPAFPVNLSIDEIAAHFTPEKNCEKIAKGLLKVDFGVAINGFIADTAISFDLTEDKRYGKMLELNKSILNNINEIVREGLIISDVGNSAQDTLEKYNEVNNTNFSIIKSLCGHSLGENNIHAGLTISNYRNDNSTNLDDMAFAIEPFVTTGDGDIYEGQPGGIYALQSDGNVRDRDAREILNFIKETFRTRPFCSRWLEDEGFKKIKFSLSTLVKQGILYHYSMLIEKSKAPVSQFENTFVIANGQAVRTTE